MEYDEEFTCSVCLNLMVDPTTLNCGHNLCRLCLAQWYITSKNKECPTCRQVWEGHPKINNSLRNLIARMHPEQLQEREQDIISVEGNDKVLQDFEAAMQRAKKRKRADYGSFFSGMIIALGIVVIAYLVYYWRGHENLLVGKPVAAWRPVDVARWLNSLVWAQTYSASAQEEGIDGHLLMGMNETALVADLLGVADPEHQKALQVAIRSLRETGLKMPVTLWEYKALYPGRALFLVYALKDFPRTTMLLLYYFYYEESFLPFLHRTAPAEWGIYPETGVGKLPDPTTFQWAVFCLFMLSFPYGMLGMFAWSMLAVHSVTPWVVICSCAMLTLLESTFYTDVLLRGAWRHWKDLTKSHFKQLLSCVFFGVFWPIAPSFVCDVAFYVCLYMSPLQLLKTVIQRMVEAPDWN